MTLLYLLIKDFRKFDPLTATGMALCVNLGPKCQNLFPLVSDFFTNLNILSYCN